MKKLLILIVLFLPLAISAEAVWSPSLGVGAAYSGTVFDASLDKNETMWSSPYISAEINPAALRFGNHIVSFPLSIGYAPSAITNDRMQLQDSVLLGFDLRYGYFITDKLLIEGSGGVRYRWYVKASAGAWSVGGGISISFFPFSFMALVLPVSAYWGEKELDFSVGLGLRFTLGG